MFAIIYSILGLVVSIWIFYDNNALQEITENLKLAGEFNNCSICLIALLVRILIFCFWPIIVTIACIESFHKEP